MIRPTTEADRLAIVGAVAMGHPTATGAEITTRAGVLLRRVAEAEALLGNLRRSSLAGTRVRVDDDGKVRIVDSRGRARWVITPPPEEAAPPPPPEEPAGEQL